MLRNERIEEVKPDLDDKVWQLIGAKTAVHSLGLLDIAVMNLDGADVIMLGFASKEALSAAAHDVKYAREQEHRVISLMRKYDKDIRYTVVDDGAAMTAIRAYYSKAYRKEEDLDTSMESLERSFTKLQISLGVENVSPR